MAEENKTEEEKKKAIDSYTKKQNNYFGQERFEHEEKGRKEIEDNLALDELSKYRERMPERRKQIGKYYRGQVASYTGFAAMAVAGVAAALAPWSLPFIATGIGVAAGGTAGVALTRLNRNSEFNVFHDWAFASSARRWDNLNRMIDTDIRRINEGRSKGVDVSHIEARVERRLERQKQRAMKAYAKNEVRYKKFLDRQQKIQDGSFTSRLSDLARFLGIKRWSKAATRREEMFKNAQHMFMSEFMEINEARAKAGLTQDKDLDNLVKDFEDKTDKAIKEAEERKLNIHRENSKLNVETQAKYNQREADRKQIRLDGFKKAIADPRINADQILRDMKDPANIDLADAMIALFEGRFGAEGTKIKTEETSKYPLFPVVKDWESGEVELDKNGEPVFAAITAFPKQGYQPVCVSMGIEEVEDAYADFDKEAALKAGDEGKEYYQKLNIKGKEVEILVTKDEVFVVRQPTKDEIKNQKIGDKKVQIKPGYMHKLSRKADGTPFIYDGQLAFEAEYEMEPVKPLDKEEKWNRVAVENGKLVTTTPFKGGYDSYKKEADLFYLADEVETKRDEPMKSDAFIEAFLKEANAEQLAKLVEFLNKKENKAIKDAHKKEITDFALKVRDDRLGKEEQETMDAYDALGAAVGGKKYSEKVSANKTNEQESTQKA